MVDPQQECLEDNTRGQKIRALNCFKILKHYCFQMNCSNSILFWGRKLKLIVSARLQT